MSFNEEHKIGNMYINAAVAVWISVPIVLILLAVAFFFWFARGAKWLTQQCQCFQGKPFRIALRVFNFSLTSVIFFHAGTLTARSSIHGLRMFSLQVKSMDDIKNLVFVDLLTVFFCLLYSLGFACLARMFPNPEPLYKAHEVLLDLTCHLDVDYFGRQFGLSFVVLLLCLVIIIVKEWSEEEKEAPGARN